MGLLDDLRAGTYDAGPAQPWPWPRGLFGQDLVSTARRIVAGDEPWTAVREFLDEYRLRPVDLRFAAVEGEPESCGDERWDALLGALAEWLAHADGLARPPWCVASQRFLRSWWVPFDRPSVVARALVEAPAAFRRRGIMIPARSLGRV